MFQTILVPTDGSALSRRAEDAAIDFARRQGAALVAFSVAMPGLDDATAGASFLGAAAIDPCGLLASAQDRVQNLVERAKAAGVPCQSGAAISYYPHEEILKAANDFHCDLIFMASHGRHGLRGFLLGSETQKVLAHATLPVLVFR
jgi:nucleotide-binding universal stress UspA family protein